MMNTIRRILNPFNWGQKPQDRETSITNQRGYRKGEVTKSLKDYQITGAFKKSNDDDSPIQEIIPPTRPPRTHKIKFNENNYEAELNRNEEMDDENYQKPIESDDEEHALSSKQRLSQDQEKIQKNHPNVEIDSKITRGSTDISSLAQGEFTRTSKSLDAPGQTEEYEIEKSKEESKNEKTYSNQFSEDSETVQYLQVFDEKLRLNEENLFNTEIDTNKLATEDYFTEKRTSLNISDQFTLKDNPTAVNSQIRQEMNNEERNIEQVDQFLKINYTENLTLEEEKLSESNKNVFQMSENNENNLISFDEKKLLNTQNLSLEDISGKNNDEVEKISKNNFDFINTENIQEAYLSSDETAIIFEMIENKNISKPEPKKRLARSQENLNVFNSPKPMMRMSLEHLDLNDENKNRSTNFSPMKKSPRPSIRHSLENLKVPEKNLIKENREPLEDLKDIEKYLLKESPWEQIDNHRNNIKEVLEHEKESIQGMTAMKRNADQNQN